MALNMAWLAAHKAVVYGGGAALAAGLYTKSKKKTGAAAPAPAATAAPVGAVNATYDSTAQDVYGSIQPQLGALQAQVTQLQNSPPASTPLTATQFQQLTDQINGAYSSESGQLGSLHWDLLHGANGFMSGGVPPTTPPTPSPLRPTP